MAKALVMALVMARAKALVMALDMARAKALVMAPVMALVMARNSVRNLQKLAANPGRLAKRISPSSTRVLAMVWPIPRRAVFSTSVWRRKIPRLTARTRARMAEAFA